MQIKGQKQYLYVVMGQGHKKAGDSLGYSSAPAGMRKKKAQQCKSYYYINKS